MKIGVLALQGDFVEHCRVLARLGADAVEVRLPGQLQGLAGLIVPGGESTTMSRLMTAYGLLRPLRDLAGAGVAIMGTCAGMILMAKQVPGFDLETLGLMDVRVRRNAFGSQADSFEADLDMPALGPPPFHAVFIRAPVIEETGAGVDVLARLSGASCRMERLPADSAFAQRGCEGAAVAARQGGLLAAAFHPELTPDTRLHRYFLDIARDN